MAANPLPEDIQNVLLDKLCNDDAFRDQFQADPREALASIGVTDDLDQHAEEAAGCLTLAQGQLPSKESIQRARKNIAPATGAAPHTYKFFKS